MSQPTVEMSDTDDPDESQPRYARSAKTHSDIQALSGLSGDALAQAFAQSDPNAADYRTAEALVHFILAALEGNDGRQIDALFKLLRARCRGYLRYWAKGLANDEDRMEVQSKVIEQLTTRLLKGRESCDFLLAKFWRYLKLRALSAIKDVTDLRAKECLIDDLGQGDDEAGPQDEVRGSALSLEDQLLIADALATLPSDLRELYVLRHFGGWRVGDERKDEADSDEPTLMEYFKIGRRAVNKRLARADKLLADYRKDPA